MFQLALSVVEEEADHAGHPVPVWEGWNRLSEEPEPGSHNPTAFIQHKGECIRRQM